MLYDCEYETEAAPKKAVAKIAARCKEGVKRQVKFSR